ncbi:hypothetical protein DB347_20805 [Opitutaceae bacterium EW11]|nr:hypothetical protein DB347_20805 [Opitutaceae bacterium EW11]
MLPLAASAGFPPPVTPPSDFVDAAQVGEYVELRGADGRAKVVLCGHLTEGDRGGTAPEVYPTTISHVRLEVVSGGVREVARYSCFGRQVLLRLVGTPKAGGSLVLQTQFMGPFATVGQDFYAVVYP